MDVVVCLKQVPLTQEVDLEVDAPKRDIKRDMLSYFINEWDNYAAEEAILLKEKTGGTVTVISTGNEGAEDVLRRALAMGADKALRIDPGDRDMDSFLKSKILAKAIEGMDYDLVFTGVQSDDFNNGTTGSMTAERLGLAHASVVNGIDPHGEELSIHIELEGGIEEVSSIKLPALLTIQTGINEPRYVSFMGIRKAAKKELKVMSLEDIGLSNTDLETMTTVEELFLPPETEGAEIIDGDASFVAEEILRIMKEKGVNN